MTKARWYPAWNMPQQQIPTVFDGHHMTTSCFTLMKILYLRSNHPLQLIVVDIMCCQKKTMKPCNPIWRTLRSTLFLLDLYVYISNRFPKIHLLGHNEIAFDYTKNSSWNPCLKVAIIWYIPCKKVPLGYKLGNFDGALIFMATQINIFGFGGIGRFGNHFWCHF